MDRRAPTDSADTLFCSRKHCVISMKPWGTIISAHSRRTNGKLPAPRSPMSWVLLRSRRPRRCEVAQPPRRFFGSRPGLRYLLRIEGPASPLRNPHQHVAPRMAAEAGIAPRVHYTDEATRAAISAITWSTPCFGAWVRNWPLNCHAAFAAECLKSSEKQKRSWSPFRAVH